VAIAARPRSKPLIMLFFLSPILQSGFFPGTFVALGLFFCISGQTALALAEPPQARQAELIHLLRQDCGACHGMTLKGGLGLPLLPETLNGKSDDSLAAIILDGVPNTPMPPWRSEISSDEAIWLVRRMKEGISK